MGEVLKEHVLSIPSIKNAQKQYDAFVIESAALAWYCWWKDKAGRNKVSGDVKKFGFKQAFHTL